MQRKTGSRELAELSRALIAVAELKLATQPEIEKATGVDQPTISRAKRGQLKRVTGKVERLIEYANMKLRPPPISTRVSGLALKFYEAGGTERELIASVEHAITLVTRRLRTKSKN